MKSSPRSLNSGGTAWAPRNVETSSIGWRPISYCTPFICLISVSSYSPKPLLAYTVVTPMASIFFKKSMLWSTSSSSLASRVAFMVFRMPPPRSMISM